MTGDAGRPGRLLKKSLAEDSRRRSCVLRISYGLRRPMESPQALGCEGSRALNRR